MSDAPKLYDLIGQLRVKSDAVMELKTVIDSKGWLVFEELCHEIRRNAAEAVLDPAVDEEDLRRHQGCARIVSDFLQLRANVDGYVEDIVQATKQQSERTT